MVTNLKDYLFHVSTLVHCDPTNLIEGFTDAEKKSIELVRQREISQEKRVWRDCAGNKA